MKINVVQLCVSRDITQNKKKILLALSTAQRDDWFIFPECALTGYFPEEDDFLKCIDFAVVSRAIEEIAEEVKQRRCHCLFGAALFADEVWHNSVVIQSYSEKPRVYSKSKLSKLDKKHFAPGWEVPIYTIGKVSFGVQICRELVFPEAWTNLKRRGAEVVFHVNNAIKPYDEVWEHILIARAVENRFFVCSVNNAAPPQKLTSYLVAPSGKLLIKAEKQVEQTLIYKIDLSEVRDLEGETRYSANS